jgi:hypothetical protein
MDYDYSSPQTWIYDNKLVCNNVNSPEDLYKCLPEMSKWSKDDVHKWSLWKPM